MKINNIFLLVAIFALSIKIQAQDSRAFGESLKGKTNFYEIMEVVNETYENLPEKIRNKGGKGFAKEKQWRRWEWLMSHYLDSTGDIVNVTEKTMEDIELINAMTPVLRSTNSGWFSVGPNISSYNSTATYCTGNGKGRVNRIAFHPTNVNIMYVGLARGGVWKTNDGGNNWVNVFDFSASVGISGIVVSVSNPNTVYVLTGDGDANNPNGLVTLFGYASSSAGVYKSINGGSTWRKTGDFPITVPYLGFQLVQNVNNPNILFAATDQGVIKTDDDGETWTNVFTGAFKDVIFRPNGNFLYATTDDLTYFSSNMGVTWTTATFDIAPPSGRRTFAVSPDNITTVYLLCGPVTGNGVFGGIYKSTNSGASYTRIVNTPNILGRSNFGTDDDDQSTYDLTIAAKPTDVDLVTTGGIYIWQSTQGGLNMSKISGNDLEPNYVHADVHDIEYNPLNGKLYACHDGGISESTDDGATWVSKDFGIRPTASYHMDKILDGGPDILLGNQDTGLKIRRTLSNIYDYEHVAGGDGFYTSFNQNDDTEFYGTTNSSLRKYTGSGSSRTDITPDNNNTFFKTVQAHNTDFDKVFCSGNQQLYYSNDGGTNWFLNTNASSSWAITSCPSNNSRFYCTGFSGLQNNSLGSAYRTDDTGGTWIDMSGSTGFPSSFTKLSDIAVRPTNSTRVWMTCSGFTDGQKVFYSGNTGTTWTNMSLNLPNIPVFCIAVASNNDAYIGTDVGIFYKAENKPEWVPFSNDLPNTVFTDIRIDEVSGFIYASSFGRGVWATQLPDGVCESNIVLADDQEGNHYYESADDITSTAVIAGSVENTIYYKAENGVTLKPPFGAGTSSKFRAYIDDCADGGIPTLQGEAQVKRLHEEEKNAKSNRSYFDLVSDQDQVTIKANIKKVSDYQWVVLDVHQEVIKILKESKIELGLYQDQFNIDQLNSQAFYIALKEGEKLIYLQEL